MPFSFSGFPESRGFEINDSGWFTGVWEPQFATQRGYVAYYNLNTGSYEIHDLGIYPGYGETWAYAINNDNTIVGGAQPLGGDFAKALIWRNGSLVPEDLNTMVSIPGATLIDAYRINNAGQILAEARLDAGGYAYYRLDPIQEWTHNGDGTWSDSINWFGPVPNALQHSANFKTVITQPVTVYSDTPHTVGTITFDNTHRYTLSGTGTITLDDHNPGRIDVISGSHVIDAPLVMLGNATINANAGSGVRISNLVPVATSVLTKNGDGTLLANRYRASTLSINAGVAGVIAAGGTNSVSRVQNLSIAKGARLDLSDSAIIVDYTGASPIDTIAAYLASGYASGSWNGNGISSTIAAITPDRAIGYAEAAEIGATSMLGETLDSTTVLLRFTLPGDATLDGEVSIGDFSHLASHFNVTGFWHDGDFNNDGTVTISDFSLLASNFNQSLPADVARGGLVPEPTFGAFLMIAAALERRRRP